MMGVVEEEGGFQVRKFDVQDVKKGGEELSRKAKLFTVVAIFIGNIAFGCAATSYNMVVTSLQTKYDTDDATISKLFTILTVCNMIGALSAGIIFNYINRQLAVIAILSVMSAMTFLTPHCPTLTWLFISVAIMGLTCGSYDIAQIVWVMEMMQKDCPPYVQAQHFFFALGTNLAGPILAPFLDNGYSEITLNHDKLLIPYSIIGLIFASAVISHFLLFIFHPYTPPPYKKIEDNENPEDAKSPRNAKKPFLYKWSWLKLRTVLLTCCFYGAYQGLEMISLEFFSKFAQNSDLHLPESQAAYVVSAMTATYAAGRAAAIIIVFKISTQFILCGNLVMVFIANILLIGWATTSLPVLWTCSILFGLGFSSCYASWSAFIERYLRFTNFVVALTVVSGCGAGVVYQLVIGSFIEKNPMILGYITFISLGVLSLAFGTVWCITRKDKTRY